MTLTESFECLTQSLDTRPLLKAIEAQPDLWNQITARQTTQGSPHVDTRTIFLRWAAAQTLEAVFNDIEAIDYPAMAMLNEAAPLVETAQMLAGASQVGRIIITSLKPGGYIKPHADEGKYADHYERFHLVLQSEPGNLFWLVNNAVPAYRLMHAGELWWFNHKCTHWVKNNSKEERIHLIIDMVSDRYKVERAA